jgi:hypothetical protein
MSRRNLLANHESPPRFPPEVQLLLAAAREWNQPPCTSTIALTEVDWKSALEAANWHGLSPLLYEYLSRSLLKGRDTTLEGRDNWSEFLNKLATLRKNIALRSLRMSSELVRILESLRKCGVTAIPFKGPAVAAALYGDVGLRPSADLDLLLAKPDVFKTSEVLLGLGYKQTQEYPPHARRMLLRFENDFSFSHPMAQVTVAVHWGLARAHYSYPLNVTDLATRLTEIDLGGRSVPMLAPEDLFYVLAMHGGKHFWERLIWLCDIRQLLVAYPGMDWNLVFNQARHTGTVRVLLFALHAAHVLVGAPLPPQVDALFRNDPAVARLTNEVLKALIGQVERSKLSFHWRRMRLRERRRDQMKYVLGLMFNPTQAEWAAIRLPQPLSFLYYPLRLARCGALLAERRRN